ncbi:hypothetical protein NBRC116493_35940 [Aurantivibrio infirmus]
MKPEDRWKEARKRIELYVDAVFWQDLGIEDPHRKQSVDWILDKLFKPEYIALLEDKWEVWRQDDNGNHFKMKEDLSYPQAKEIVAEYTAKGHKQFYWVLPKNAR